MGSLLMVLPSVELACDRIAPVFPKLLWPTEPEPASEFFTQNLIPVSSNKQLPD